MPKVKKKAVVFSPEEIKKLYEEFVRAFSKLAPDVMDFFLLHVVNGVEEEEAWDMTHFIPEGTGKNPVLNRRRKIKKEFRDACQKTSYRVALEKWAAYNCANALDYREYVLTRAKAIADAEIGKTTYRHPKSGKVISRAPQQLGRNESIAATQVTSVRGVTTYKMESKIAALNIIKDVVGLNAAKEVNVHNHGGVFGEIRIGFDDDEEEEDEEEDSQM